MLVSPWSRKVPINHLLISLKSTLIFETSYLFRSHSLLALCKNKLNNCLIQEASHLESSIWWLEDIGSWHRNLNKTHNDMYVLTNHITYDDSYITYIYLFWLQISKCLFSFLYSVGSRVCQSSPIVREESISCKSNLSRRGLKTSRHVSKCGTPGKGRLSYTIYETVFNKHKYVKKLAKGAG